MAEFFASLPPSFWVSVAAILVLLALSGFFSGSETALTAASRARIHHWVKSGNKRAKLVEKLTADKERLIGALLLGNNLVNILASSLATSVLIALFGDTGVIYATIVMTALVVIFSEVLPKTWAISKPDEFALGVAPFVRPIVALFAPITFAIQKLVNALLRLLGARREGDDTGMTGHDELRGTVDLLHRDGEVVKNDRDMLGGILDLSALEVSDVMVHRTKMLALDADLPKEQLVQEILESPYTRIPLWKDDQENIVGVMHAKDLLRALFKAGGDVEQLDINAIVSKPWFVPDTTPVQAQLNAFLLEKAHFALVVDEYGEVEGLITLEDILEEIVGEIADEHDEVMQGAKKQPDGSYIVEGSLPIRDLNRALDWNLPDENATTIAGLVLDEAKMIPNINQTFTFHGKRFSVLKKERNRITELRIIP
ncbi:HlyC/CorC family transporter [Maritalea sp.]|jgi:Mg2+/Co2+ transporter CorB|uniref:HlyC/CorC family transporter n=1 Tax=Maritalea sp. TaxID=2003361 RepID=UPI0039E71634